MFEKSLTPFDGILILISFGVLMISVTLFVSRRREKTKKEFLLANRHIGLIPGAFAIGASWIWAPAMFVSSQKTYQQGVAGLFWYLVPNIGTLIIFGPFARKLRMLLPEGYTLPQYIALRHGKSAQIAYLIQFLTLQVCALGVQILAASQLLSTTTGLNPILAASLIVIVPLTYAIIGGLRASVATDFLQMVAMIIACAVTVPWVISKTGGYATIISGFGGITGKFTNPLDPWVFYSFGISITIGLLSGPLGDQMQWQRAYALRDTNKVQLTFLIGAFVFGSVPLTLSHLGFVAANPTISGAWNVTDPQMIGAITIAHLLPHYMTVIFVVMVLVALCSTIDSSFCAIASLVTTDLFSCDHRSDNDAQQRLIARLSMAISAILGLAIAAIPNLQILHLFLFYGTMRASTMIPTILTLMWPRLKSKVVLPTIILSFLFGAPLMAIGNLIGNIHLSVAGSLLVVIVGIFGCVGGSLLNRSNQRTQQVTEHT